MLWTFESLVGKGTALSRTMTNRIITLVWAAACVVGVSGVTASLSAELTANKLNSSVSGPNDLPRVKVGTVKRPSGGSGYLDGRSIPFTPYDDVGKAVEGLARGDVDAVVFEAPILQYEVAKLPPGKVAMLPGTFWNHSYGFGLRSGSDLRESLDRTILKLGEREEYKKIFARYLGTAE
jgi:ABC-type amino acid transport substrate-binding protein